MSVKNSLVNLFKKKLLSSQQEKQLLQAISNAEKKTSGEIRVHIESKHASDPVTRAKEIFKKLNMHETINRNGILFYLAIHSKQFAIWGDEGIHLKVSQEFWDEISEVCIANFKDNSLIEGLEAGITLCGDKLKLYFPLHTDDKNELKDEISY